MSERAVIYARLSRDDGAKKDSLPNQIKMARDRIEVEGWDLREVYSEVGSAYKPGNPRPAWDRLRAAGMAGEFDTLVTREISRLGRNVQEALEAGLALSSAGILIVTLYEGTFDLATAEGFRRFTENVNASQFESARASERIKSALAGKRSRGERFDGALAFGWRWVDPCPGGKACRHPKRANSMPCNGDGRRKRLHGEPGQVPDEVRAAVLREAYGRVEAGDPLYQIAKDWNARGFHGAKGSPFTATSLGNVLKNPKNAGFFVVDGEEVEHADGLRIVDRDQFDRVHAILSDPTRFAGRSGGKPALLRGIAMCAVCGGYATRGKQRLYSGITEPCYTHIDARVGARPDQHFTRIRRLVDTYVLAVVEEVLMINGEAIRKGIESAAEDDAPALLAEIAATRKRLADLLALLNAGEIEPADYAPATKSLRAKLRGLEASRTKVMRHPAVESLLEADSPVDAFREMVARDDQDAVRAILLEMIAEVVIGSPGRGRGKVLGEAIAIRWSPWLGFAEAPAAHTPPPPPVDPLPGQMRVWAASQGIAVAARGAVPKRVQVAYFAAHPEQDPRLATPLSKDLCT